MLCYHYADKKIKPICITIYDIQYSYMTQQIIQQTLYLCHGHYSKSKQTKIEGGR